MPKLKTPKTAVLGGSSSKLLAKNIAENSNYQNLSYKVVHFVNSEMKITLPQNINDFENIFIIQSTSNPANDSLMEICLLADTLQYEKISNITAIIPYFGYARQDKQHLPKECISIFTITKIFKTVGIKKIITADIHNHEVLQNLDLEIQNISVLPNLAKQIYAELGLNKETEKEITIASPDDGGIERAKLFSKHFYQDQKNSEFVSIKKIRRLDREHFCEAVELRGEIKDKKLILIDDISTSGSTILNALELCKANGVKEVYVVIVHADFAKGVAEKFQNSEIKKVYTTNTIEKTVENLDFYSKFKVLDVSKVFEI
jgi:ribose-phosphate pyrophosphokinase